MNRLVAIVAMTTFAGCAGEFGQVSRSARVSDSARITATAIVPDDAANRSIIEHLALAEEIYNKTLEALRDRRNTLRSRGRSLTLTSYATFAATTLVIAGAAISKGDTMSGNGDMRTFGYGALGGLGLGTTLGFVNFMQEDPANVDAKIRHLQSSYDGMTDRLRVLFEEAEASDAAAPPAVEGKPLPRKRSLEVKAGPIIEAFINEALQINIKG